MRGPSAYAMSVQNAWRSSWLGRVAGAKMEGKVARNLRSFMRRATSGPSGESSSRCASSRSVHLGEEPAVQKANRRQLGPETMPVPGCRREAVHAEQGWAFSLVAVEDRVALMLEPESRLLPAIERGRKGLHHQVSLPGSPLNGPTSSALIQPP